MLDFFKYFVVFYYTGSNFMVLKEATYLSNDRGCFCIWFIMTGGVPILVESWLHQHPVIFSKVWQVLRERSQIP